MRLALRIVAAVACLSVGVQAEAAFPFVENFTAGAANWKNNSSGELTHFASGGPGNSAYVSSALDLPAYTAPTPPYYIPLAPIVFRAQATDFNSSNSAYRANWITAGIKEVTAYLRHDASVPLVWNVRFAEPDNNPGGSYETPAIAPNVWTKVVIDVTPTSPQNITFGSGSYNTVFDDVGNIQFSAVVPAGFAGESVTFDLDRVTVAVPEPSTLGLGLGALGLLALAARRRR